MNARHAVVTAARRRCSRSRSPGPWRGAGFVDVLDTPAQASPLASKRLLQAVARAGRSARCRRPARPRRRFDGRRQDLEAVDGAGQLGSDGRVLRRRQERLGRRPRRRRPRIRRRRRDRGSCSSTAARPTTCCVRAMERKVAAEPASESAKALLAEAKRYKEQGADKPFLDVWFADAQNGYVVGAYNLIFRTADGGKTWEPWFDRTDNPKFFNLYSIRPCAGGPLHRRRGRARAEARRGRAALQGARGSLQRQLLRRRRPRETPCSPSGCAATSFAATTAARRGPRSTPGLRRRSSARRRTAGGAMLLADAGGRVAASRDGGRSFAPSRSSRRCRSPASPTPATGDSRWRARAASPSPSRPRPDVDTTRTHTSWPPLSDRSRRDAGRPRRSRNSTRTPATGSSGWCSTTGWRWSSSARSSRWCWATSRRRGSC